MLLGGHKAYPAQQNTHWTVRGALRLTIHIKSDVDLHLLVCGPAVALFTLLAAK